MMTNLIIRGQKVVADIGVFAGENRVDMETTLFFEPAVNPINSVFISAGREITDELDLTDDEWVEIEDTLQADLNAGC